MNKILKLAFALFVCIFLVEISSVSNKYVNKPFVTLDVNNITNPQIKKLVRKIDNYYALFLLKFSKQQKKHLDHTDSKYQELPKEKIIYGKKNNFTISSQENANNLNNWHRSHGNNASNRFSDLSQININNVENLDVAWKFEFRETMRDIQANPVIAENKIFTPTTNRQVIALNAKNGKKIWEHNVKGTPARRGIIYWPGNDDLASRIYFCVEKELISLYAKNGKPVKTFGKNGSVKLKKRCLISPAIINDKIAIGTFEPAVEIYNLFSGKLSWKYYLKEKKFNKNRHGEKDMTTLEVILGAVFPLTQKEELFL